MFNAFIAILALAGYVNGHGFITDIRGANGKTSNGFGVGVAPFKATDGQGWFIGDGGADSDNLMTITIPSGTICSGGSTANACLLRVINPPGFGSCFAIALSGSSGGAVPNPSSTVETSTSAVATSSSAAVTTTSISIISKSTSVSTSSVVASSTSAAAETSASTPAAGSSSSAVQCAVIPTVTVTVTPTPAASSTPRPTETVTRGSTAAATAKTVKAGKKHHKVNSAKIHPRPRGTTPRGVAAPQRMRRIVKGL
ncbi:hypothetical protein FRC06_005077 [Ceratobasidium sp. 370]|nr:hypothetical protein FRC06_005077 [Ceratobasidium sp. 370]